MFKLSAQIASLSTQQIVDAVRMIGGGAVDVDRMLVRAALFQAYEVREGEDAVDDLLDALGM